MTRSKRAKTPYEEAVSALQKRARRNKALKFLWQTIHAYGTSPPDAGTYVLVTGSAIEQALETAITSHFVTDREITQSIFDDNGAGPLATFAAKIRMGYALGIYEKTIKNELDLIRHIRNAFAHAKELTDFATPEIVDACNQLYLPTRWRIAHGTDDPVTPQTKFRTSVDFLFLYLETSEGDGPKRYGEAQIYSLLVLGDASPRK